MVAIGDLLDAIETSPAGPSVGALFVDDRALVAGAADGGGAPDASVSAGGDPAAEARRRFVALVAPNVYPESRDLVEAHRRRSHTVIICTSAPRHEVQPLAEDLGVDHVVSVDVAADDLAVIHEIDLGASFAYGGGDGDLRLLEQFGHPCALNPTRGLQAAANARGWPTARWTSRGAADPLMVARTVAALGSVVPSFLAAVPAGILGGGRRAVFTRGMSTWGRLSTALAGVTLHVEGRENLRKQRPAVFIMNHQSGLDGLIGAALFEDDYTVVASAKLRRNPIIGPIGWLADAAFVESGPEAVKSLESVTKVIESGVSIGIAPEGTRSPTRRVGPFKKGAFRIAMASGVPVVPVVVRNAGDLMPGKSVVIRPGTVDVRVLEPIPVDDWTLENLDARIEEVHQLYVQTLADWPRRHGS